MKFPKDILIIDFEGFKNPLQIGAVLLDRETLEEKDSFVSYIYADMRGFVSPTSGINQELVNDAPKQEEIGKMIYDKFGVNLFIASWVQSLDITHFARLMSAAGIDFVEGTTDFKKYDFHVLDIWPIAYVHALKQGYTGSVKSEEMFKYFGAKPRGLHNALEDCRIAADVLRKITA